MKYFLLASLNYATQFRHLLALMTFKLTKFALIVTFQSNPRLPQKTVKIS